MPGKWCRCPDAKSTQGADVERNALSPALGRIKLAGRRWILKLRISFQSGVCGWVLVRLGLGAGRQRSGVLLCRVEVAPSPEFLSSRNYNLPLFTPSEDQDELHYQDTDLDVPEQRDGRCKVKWTPEEVSESLKFADRCALGWCL